MQKYNLVLEKCATSWDESLQWKMESTKDVFLFARDVIKITNRSSECVWVIALSVAGEVIGCLETSKGSLSASIVSIQNILQFLILSNAAAAVITHVHPSGRVAESQEDVNVTRKLASALELFEIKMIDHVIVSGEEYNSLAAKGLI